MSIPFSDLNPFSVSRFAVHRILESYIIIKHKFDNLSTQSAFVCITKYKYCPLTEKLFQIIVCLFDWSNNKSKENAFVKTLHQPKNTKQNNNQSFKNPKICYSLTKKNQLLIEEIILFYLFLGKIVTLPDCCSILHIPRRSQFN